MLVINFQNKKAFVLAFLSFVNLYTIMIGHAHEMISSFSNEM
jgi:hypothetical protein